MNEQKPKVFDTVHRTDMSAKKRTENTYVYLNRSALPGSAESRALVETWLSRVPATEHAHFFSHFRYRKTDVKFTSALQELTLHELLRRQGCTLRFHPNVPDTNNQPDFNVLQPGGSEFLLEACMSTKVLSGPDGGPRADRIRDYLQGFDLQGFGLDINELTEGSEDLRLERLAKHINDGIKTAVVGDTAKSISIPLLTTDDGWRIKLTAFPTARSGTRRGTVRLEVWGRTWTGPSYPLRDCLKKKGGRYGNRLAVPYVIGVNSSDYMLGERHLEETLFGARPETVATGSPMARGFWGTATAPEHLQVSAVLFTQSLWPATLLMGQVYSCLYLNPWADQPYDGVLTKLPTFRFENGALRKYAGVRLHRLLLVKLKRSAFI